MVLSHELELAVGDVIQVGDMTVTVIDIDGEEVTFRVENEEPHDGEHNGFATSTTTPLPR